MMPLHRVAVLTLLLSSTPGCGADAPASESSLEAAAPAATERGPEPTPPALTDPQIAHVAVTANAIDVDMARLVEARTNTPAVRGFAETMIADHTGVNQEAASLAERLGVTPQENEMSRSLAADAAVARAELEPLEGEEFDRAYLEREVAYHAAVLDALDQTLIPGTSNPELRALLQQVRPVIAAHLDQARSIQSSLGLRR